MIKTMLMTLLVAVGLHAWAVPGTTDFGTPVNKSQLRGLKDVLVGEIVDLKTRVDPKKKAVVDLGYNGNGNDFFERLKPCSAGNFTDTACKGVRKLDAHLAADHLFIPLQSAYGGLHAFGVASQMGRAGWVAHYTGKLKCTENARYRFWGYFDDFMQVKIDGQVVWEYTWPCSRIENAGRVSGWKLKDSSLVGKYRAPQNRGYLAPSDWWFAHAGRTVRIDITCGEKAGGAVGGILLIEKKGETYPMNTTGEQEQPIFPIFATRPLEAGALGMLTQTSGRWGWNDGFVFKIGTDNIPIFNADPEAVKAAQAAEIAKEAQNPKAQGPIETFCGFVFGSQPSGDVPTTGKLKKPFRKFTDYALTYTEATKKLSGVTIFYVDPNGIAHQDEEEEKKILSILSKKYNLTFKGPDATRVYPNGKNGPDREMQYWENVKQYGTPSANNAFELRKEHKLTKEVSPELKYSIIVTRRDIEREDREFQQRRKQERIDSDAEGMDAL